MQHDKTVYENAKDEEENGNRRRGCGSNLLCAGSDSNRSKLLLLWNLGVGRHKDSTRPNSEWSLRTKAALGSLIIPLGVLSIFAIPSLVAGIVYFAWNTFCGSVVQGYTYEVYCQQCYVTFQPVYCYPIYLAYACNFNAYSNPYHLKWCPWAVIPSGCYTNPYSCPGIKDPGGFANTIAINWQDFLNRMKAQGPNLSFVSKVPVAIPGVTVMLQKGQTPPTEAQIQAQINHIQAQHLNIPPLQSQNTLSLPNGKTLNVLNGNVFIK